MVEVGAAPPAFHLENQRDERVSPDSLRGQWVVLYFYPRDDTRADQGGLRVHGGHRAFPAATRRGSGSPDSPTRPPEVHREHSSI